MLAEIAERYKDLFYINLANNLGYFIPMNISCVPPIGRVVGWQVCTGNRIQRRHQRLSFLPSNPYVKGNIRQESLRNIWDNNWISLGIEERVNSGDFAKAAIMPRLVREMSWTSHTLLGKRGNMPYCYHRADMLAQQGLYEILQQTQRVEGNPFDYGQFELHQRPLPSKEEN